MCTLGIQRESSTMLRDASLGKMSEQGCADTKQGRAAHHLIKIWARCAASGTFTSSFNSLRQNILLTHTIPPATPRHRPLS